MNTTLLTVPIVQVQVAPQVRKHFDEDRLRELSASIAESGLQQPLLCRKAGNSFILIDGERRLRAVELLAWEQVPILVVSDAVGIADALTRQLACNMQREDLTVLERAEGIRTLMHEASLTAEQVAKKLGQSAATVSRTLSVLKLPEQLRAKVSTGEISADAAYLLARVEEPERQTALATEVASGRLTRDALTRKLKRVRRTQEAHAAGPARITAALGSGRSVTVTGKGLSFESLIQALEQLLGRARKSKAQGLSLETFVRTLRDQATA